MFHFSCEHDAHSLEASVWVIWKSSSSLMGRKLEFVEHEEWVHSNAVGPYGSANLNSGSFHHLLTFYHLRNWSHCHVGFVVTPVIDDQEESYERGFQDEASKLICQRVFRNFDSRCKMLFAVIFFECCVK